MTVPAAATGVHERVQALVADLRDQGLEVRWSASPDGLRFSVDVRLPSAPAGPVDVVLALQPGLKLMCCGCSWTAAAASYAQLETLAAGHDDAPAQQHIVRLAAGGRFPTDQAGFDAELERVRGL